MIACLTTKYEISFRHPIVDDYLGQVVCYDSELFAELLEGWKRFINKKHMEAINETIQNDPDK